MFIHPVPLISYCKRMKLDQDPVERPQRIPLCANLVLTTSVNVPLNLVELVGKMPYLEYNPKSFAARDRAL